MTVPVSTARQLAPTRAAAVGYAGTDGRRIAALRAVPDGEPRAVLLLVPGYTGSKEDFAPLLDPLATAGFEAVAIDLPGQYRSPGPSDPAAYLPDALATDLVLVAGALRSERPEAGVHLLGHSYGGLVARATVIAAPAAFDSLVLLDSGPAAIGGTRRSLIDAMESVLATGGVAAVYQATLTLGRRDPRWVEPPAPLADFLRTRFEATAAACLEGMGHGIRHEPDRVAELAVTGVRALVVCGAGDDAWSVASQQDMATRLGVRCEVVPDAEHSPAVENPGALLDVVVPFWSDAAV